MSKSNTFETELLSLIFLNVAIPNLGNAAGLQPSSAAGSVYAALHTADPGEAGTAATNEVVYPGYARQPLGRNGANFSVTSPGGVGTLTQLVNLDFPKATGAPTGSGTITHFSYVKEVSGASVILYSGPVANPQTVAAGVIPRLEGSPAGTPTTVTED